MREEYDFLTAATKDGLTDNVKRAASGWGKSPETLYQILRGEKQDPFAYFASFYEGMCEGGVPTETWDLWLAYLREKHRRKGDARCVHAEFRVKNHAHSGLLETYLAAAADGSIDLKETEALLGLVSIEEPLIASLKASLLAHKAKLEHSAADRSTLKRVG